MKKSFVAAIVALPVLLAACTGPSATQAQPTSTQTQQAQAVNQAAQATQPAQAVNGHAVASQNSVAQLSGLRDGSMVRLQGRITKALHDEHYEFTDATGTVVVEIDHDLWHGRTITANDVITLVGEVDVEYRPMKQVTVDVQMVEF